MAVAQNPTDLARDTLRILASRRLPPTPDNFTRIYAELSGAPLPEPAPAKGEAGKPDGQPWARVIRDLLRQWEIKHAGLTTARKKEGLERVLINFGGDAETLRAKLKGLVDSWSQTPAGRSALDGEPDPPPAPVAAPAPRAAPDVAATTTTRGAEFALMTLRDLLVEALREGVVPRLTRFPDLADEATLLADQAATANDARSLAALGRNLHQFWRKLEMRADGDRELIAGLTGLLQLMAENIGELVIDEHWVHGQVDMLRQMLDKPLNAQSLQQAERSLRDIIIKQGSLKHSLKQAQDAMKNLMADFISRIGEMSESTGEFHDKIGTYAERVKSANDISTLSRTLEEFLGETRAMQMDMLRSRDSLLSARRQVEQAEARVRALEQELAEVSELVREDHLTGSLNRRGLDDAFEREIARSERSNSPLCVALLDLDHFKRLNDTYGHDAGDGALVHLVGVVKETLRPTDVIARYGGEEFVIILPDTRADEAVKVMTRLQRDLTRKFFLHENERLLITFSAGVAERARGERADSLMSRADAALYQAKNTGRNRVVLAAPLQALPA